jgi:hypothetical protein
MKRLTSDRDFLSPTSSATRPLPWRELAARRTGGTVVRLYWRPREDDVFVSVEDGLSGEHFVLERPRNDALAAFYHPYALRPARQH